MAKTFREREFSKIAPSWKGYLANLTRCINRAVDLLKKPNNFFYVALISENLEFALFKLEPLTDEYCKYASSNQQSQAKTLSLENKNRCEIAIKQCKQYLDREETLSQVQITNLSIDEFFDGSSDSSSSERFPRNESVAEILDIKDSLIPGKEPIDAFIDNLIDGDESIIPDVNKVLPTSLLLQREFETRDLPAINLMRFDGDSKQWPNFIQIFKHRVHNKISFSDSVRIYRLLSVLDGEAKRVVSAVGQDGIFYASALKFLKREFGNPLMVSYLKLKEVLELPQIQFDDQNSLRNYHQKLKTIVTWYKTMGYDGALKSVENVTKAIMRLPKYL